MLRSSFILIAAVLCIPSLASSQISVFPYVEHFDSVSTPYLPQGWTASGFVTDSGTAKSGSVCIYTKGNQTTKQLTSPSFNFSNHQLDKLVYFERRSSTALAYRLEIRASIDGVNFNVLLARFDTSTSSTSYVQRLVSLRGLGLENQASVRLRWQLLGDSTTSTGILRIDEVTVTTPVSYDLSVASLSIQPAMATSNDSIIFKALVKNFGNQAASNYSINFFLDADSNSILEVSERFASIPGVPVPVADSVAVAAGHSPLKPGSYKIFAVVSLPLDERTLNDTASTTITIGYPKGSILVNEFMYCPAGDEPEWVELLNCSGDTVNLKNWRISDNNVSSKSLMASSNLLIPPKGFCIIAKEASFNSYHPSVSCPVIVANFSALNNATPDAVIIYDQRSISVDSVSYAPAMGGQNGKSLERIDADQSSTDSKNWGTSQDSVGSTPGRPNSIERLDYDLLVGSCYQTHVESDAGLVTAINCIVRNVGKNPANSYSLILYVDADRDGLNESNEVIVTLNPTGTLYPSDSALYTYSWPSAPQGESVILAIIEFAQDQRSANNRSSAIYRTCYNSRSVVINEIMFDPLVNQNEWIELYNRSGETVDLKNWKLKDRPTSSGNVNSFTISAQPVLLQHGEFAVLAADSTIFALYPDLANPTTGCHVLVLNESGGFSLGNDGDDIILRDLTNTTIDSVSYSPRWHRPDVTDTKGRSLEKINPDLDSNSPYNWTTSVPLAGGTPGKPNSSYTVGSQSVSALSFTPNPFSPDGDGFEDFCLVEYQLPFNSALIHIKIFDLRGRLVRILANSQISSSSGKILWDGLDQSRQRVRIGPYIVLIQATDPDGKVSTTLKGVVVVAAQM